MTAAWRRVPWPDGQLTRGELSVLATEMDQAAERCWRQADRRPEAARVYAAMAAEMTDLMTGAVDQFIRIGPQPETGQEPEAGS
jgi:hypothetical protein